LMARLAVAARRSEGGPTPRLDRALASRCPGASSAAAVLLNNLTARRRLLRIAPWQRGRTRLTGRRPRD
jgi:hypothetical protein